MWSRLSPYVIEAVTVCIQVRSEGRHCLIARIVNEGDPVTWGPPHVINDTYHTYSHVCAPTKVRV